MGSSSSASGLSYDDFYGSASPQGPYQDDPVSPGLKVCTVDFRSSGSAVHKQCRPHVPEGQMWTDNTFTLPVAVHNYADKGIQWMRPQSIVASPVLFSDGTSRFDIKQQHFGTCWFMAKLADIAEKPDVRKKVVNEDSYRPLTDGVFHCRFWVFGQWKDIYTDDFLPVYHRNNKPYLYGATSGTDMNEMWVPLMEKALAKHYGSYNEVGDEGGYSSDACLTLTGGVTEIISLQPNKQDPHQLFHSLRQILVNGAFIKCSLIDGSINSTNMGLIGRHAYSLTETRMVTRRNGEKVPLLRIRNPQGNFQWKGKWSDVSTEWMTVVDEDKINSNREDGEFWMSTVDFMQRFSQIMICCRRPDCIVYGGNKPMKYALNMYGAWSHSAAGRGRNVQERLQNPRFQFTINHEGLAKDGLVPLYLQLVQKTRTLQNDSMRCDLFRINRVHEKTKTINVRKIENTVGNNNYVPRLHTNFRFKLKPGRYLAVPSTEKMGIQKEFLMRLFCASPLLQCRVVLENITVRLDVHE